MLYLTNLYVEDAVGAGKMLLTVDVLKGIGSLPKSQDLLYFRHSSSVAPVAHSLEHLLLTTIILLEA